MALCALTGQPTSSDKWSYPGQASENWTRKILAQEILIFPNFFTRKPAKFNLIFILIFPDFLPLFLTKNILFLY